MNLQLRHIQQYPLGPEGLRVKLNENGWREYREYVNEKESLYGDWWITHIDFNQNTLCLWNDLKDGCEEVELYQIQLLLHPLSSITKQGVYNGEECVPLMELSKIAFKSSPSHEIRIDLNAVHLGVGYYFKYNEIDQSFEVMKGYDGKRWDYQCYVPKQAELFAAMSERMIDWQNLIGQEVAVDINTVEK